MRYQAEPERRKFYNAVEVHEGARHAGVMLESLLLTQVAIILAAASRNPFSGAIAFGMAMGFVIFMLLAGSMWCVAAMVELS